VFQRCRRRGLPGDNFFGSLFLGGASYRVVGELLERLGGVRVSASAVSEFVRVLEAEARRFHKRRFAVVYRFLFLDGVWVMVSGYNVVLMVVLVAYGVRADGRREVLDFRLAACESADAWEAFLEELYRRGLKGARLVMVRADGGGGLNAAEVVVCPQVPRQRCRVHKLRNVSQMVRVKHR